jgi:RNA polymerase sigma factor for flagellar operon FliA
MLEHLPMVRFLAKRIHGRLPQNVELGDLVSAGLVGLMEASVKFDPEKNIRFASYAQFRVRGAILDSLRILDWAPRELRQKGRAIQEAIRTLAARLGHAPAEDQIAGELKISLESYQKLLGDLHGLEVGALHRERKDDSGEEEEVYIPTPVEDDPLFRCMQGELKGRLTAAIESLPHREKLVATLYYYEEMTRSEIALALGMDGITVSQIRASAMLHLRAALSDLAPRVPQTSRQPVRMPWVGAMIPQAVLMAKPAA